MSEPTTTAAALEPQRHLEIRATLFGSTLAAVAGALDELPMGGLIAVRTNDPWAVKDIPIWARWNGQEIVKIEGAETGWYTYHIRKRAGVGGRFALQRVWARARRVGRSAWRLVAGLRSREAPPPA